MPMLLLDIVRAAQESSDTMRFNQSSCESDAITATHGEHTRPPHDAIQDVLERRL
jgi:hypothetical protein